MTIQRDFSRFKMVRLNATLFPISRYEAELYSRYHFNIHQAEVSEPGDILCRVGDCDALFAVSVALPAAVIEGLSRCRVISRLGAGTDKIDVGKATEKGILVTNVPDFCVEEQAEHTMALLLALVRKLPKMSDYMSRGAWKEARSVSNSNHRLPGQVLGLVGFGRSARAVARRAAGFGMRLLATRRDLNASSQAARELGVKMVDLEILLARSDIVSLHLNLNDETYHLLDAGALRRMKPGALLINTSRGALVDETALVRALQEGHLAGAGLDTFEQINVHTEDEKPVDHPLLTLDNVVLTPHVAALSVEAQEKVAIGGVHNVTAVLSGFWPVSENVVNPTVIPRLPLRHPL